MPDNGLVTVTVNGREVRTEPGRTLIDVAEEMGIFIPRFCYHPGMKSVAVCRMCLVQVEGQRKLLPACATPVADGMKANTVDEQAVDAQKGMLEFLLINHPLDCPICDRGGECPLQDQTFRHGPGSSRYVEPKRTYEKALEISDLVVLDRERCVLCWRCVRFADEIAGDRFIQLVDRGAGTQILTFSDEPFDSYFSGNTIQICPVGALTSKPYRFVARPWDLKTSSSVCAYCSVGCPMTNEARSETLVRCQALPNENVNDFWTCDKGRFGYHYVHADERLSNPLMRGGEQRFEIVSWGAALQSIAERLGAAKGVGVIAGGHLTTEDAFALARLAKKAIGTPHVDSRVQDDGAPYELALSLGGVAGSTATLNDVESARSIVWVGPDPKETLPVLYLRLRKAVMDGGAKLTVVSPRRMSLDQFATHVVRCDAGGEAAAVDGLRSAAPDRTNVAPDLGEPLVVCWGPSSPGRDEGPVFEAVLGVARERGAKLLVCPPHAGSQGLIDMGVHPSLDAGYVVRAAEGKGTREILEGLAAGELDALVVVGADLVRDFPDAGLARRALEASDFTVVVELFATDTALVADVVLPSAAYAEREGTFTNLERRLQKLEPLLAPPGSAQEPWRICADIATALGDDWEWSSYDDVWSAICKEVPTHATVDAAALTQQAPPTALNYESPYELHRGARTVAGAGGGYPKGHRAGAPFQMGQNWPLSWELRAFEAKQRPGFIPPAPEVSEDGASSSTTPGRSALEARATGNGEFVLYTGRMIYDDGNMVSRSRALAAIARGPFVEMAETDATRLGLSEGDRVIVASEAGEVEAPVTFGDIATGAVFIPYDQEGLAANRLMAGRAPMVTVRKP
ncbi:MAG: NADH-quinone oxidoreductase subunit NuoG [Actinomycetota bacterium]